MEQSVGPVIMQGTGAEDLAFRSMQFFEGVGIPFRYTVEVMSDKLDLEAKTYLGQALSIVLEIADKDPRIFSGIVTEFGLYGSVGENTLYRIVLQPWLSLLRLTSNCRIFQDQSVPDIALAVFRKHGLSDVELRLSVPHEPRPYVVQYRESDYDFVCRLLEDEGIYFYFQHAPGQHTLVLCDSLAAHEPAPSCDKLPYFPLDPNRRLTIEYVERWQVNSRVESGAHALRDFNYETASAKMDATDENPAEHDNGAFELYDYPGVYADSGAGKVIAKRRLREMQATRSRVEAAANARGLLAGALLTLEKHPNAVQNREYLVLSLSGTIRSHALQSEGEPVEEGDVYLCQFECIDTQLPYVPPRRTPKPIIHGAQTATVVGGKDSEIFTDEYGRVRLQFHWDRYSPGNENSSCWVRVAQAWAGSGFGAVFTPRIGHEVLVDFLEGDPDRPIVTGSVYNSDHMPPYLPLNASQSGIKTRSTRKGSPDNFNEIRFEDKIGEEQLFMQAEKDHVLNVKNNRSATIGAADSISVGASRSVSVTKNLSVTVGTGGAAESTLHVTGTHRTDATDTVDVQAPNHVKLTCGKSSITLTDGKIELVVAGGGKIVIDGNVLSESKDGSRVLLDPRAFMRSSGDSTLLLDANACLTSSGKSQALLDGDATLTSTKGACNVQGATKVALQGASVSQLDLEAAGATMTSPTTKVAGKGLTEITGPMVKIN